MRIDLFIHSPDDHALDRLRSRVKYLIGRVEVLRTQGTQIMASLDDLNAKVEQLETVQSGLSVIVQATVDAIAQLRLDLQAALGRDLTPEQQAKVDAAFAKVDHEVSDIAADTQRLADSLVANTPSAPTP